MGSIDFPLFRSDFLAGQALKIDRSRGKSQVKIGHDSKHSYHPEFIACFLKADHLKVADQ